MRNQRAEDVVEANVAFVEVREASNPCQKKSIASQTCPGEKGEQKERERRRRRTRLLELGDELVELAPELCPSGKLVLRARPVELQLGLERLLLERAVRRDLRAMDDRLVDARGLRSAKEEG